MAWKLSSLERAPYKINKTQDILQHLERNIQAKDPFSLIRFGDACLGIMAAFLCTENIDFGQKWGSDKGLRAANSIMNQLSIPVDDRVPILRRVIEAANNADYIDSYDSDMIGKFRLGLLAFRWKEIHQNIGITNQSYCSTMFHNFINVKDEYNIFDIIKDRKIFCVNNVIPKLQPKLSKKCEKLDFYRIPGRGEKRGHYKYHFEKLCETLEKNAQRYDLFLIGAGLLASIYCDVVKRSGGRALDVGTLFYLWKGMQVKSRASRYLTNKTKGLLCERIKTPHDEALGIW